MNTFSITQRPSFAPTPFAHLLLLLSFSFSTFAQANNGTVTGTIQASNGNPISGATISVVHLESSQRSQATTNTQGVFRIESLVPGGYTLQVATQGASLSSRLEIIQAGQTIDLGTLTLTLPTTTSAAPTGGQATAATSEEIPERVNESVTVTARRVEEEVQDVPLPVSVVSGPSIERAGAFNVNRLKELIPTVQFYSSNPRNSSINIRGLGSPFGLTNDGIDSGVGFYVDGVFFARTAAATLDFLDLERIEILRGPQGTLFGKNTTAGAINITTRKPSFTPEQNFEVSFGNYGFVQAKGSFSGPLGSKAAGRISFSGTQRDGLLYNVRTQDDINDLNNLGIRGQLLLLPLPNVSIMLAADYTRQRPEGYAQVVVGIAPTLRAANRQYSTIASSLGYKVPSLNPFDRQIDTDSPWRSNQDMGGGSVTIDWDRGSAVLTSVTAWRFWDWDPSNDRDFIGLPITTVSAAPSNQRQFTQEVRYAGKINPRTNFLVGAFTFRQNLQPDGFHKQEQGSAAAAFLLAPSANASTPGLLDGYGQNIDFDFDDTSTAVFGQVEYAITERIRLIPGLRYNYDNKKIDYNQTVYGGLQTTNAALIALQRSILSPLAYTANIGDHNVSGQMTISYKTSATSNAYATYSNGFKSIGLNLGGVPTDAAGNPITSAATVRPEQVRHVELGFKSQPKPGYTANLAVYNTNIRDFQTQVVNSQVGVLRGYLANAKKVRVRGVEFDGSAKLNPELTVYGAVAFTDGRYMSFTDAPPPMEETGGPQVKDVSGSTLPGISKWAFSTGAEYVKRGTFLTLQGEYYGRLDLSFRSAFSSNPSASRYLNVDSYALVNPRVGFRSRDGWGVSVWARNLGNKNYFEFLSPQPGNTGLYTGLPGDQRTFGLTLSRSFTGN